ncbi:hypothetical protein N7466_006925 [Penicillium verhagenii]|uniref:uncharacterized protein n=1 Tax=Penicillium verhagenii TaxID=1562060 RepID=UPI002545AE26|nr:uncharacterized protein N7466_006925 [Penicillium verhagenii]KAJ5927969.1 hypothetical protein N7466_006925 [Penicillium verhagenii]
MTIHEKPQLEGITNLGIVRAFADAEVIKKPNVDIFSRCSIVRTLEDFQIITKINAVNDDIIRALKDSIQNADTEVATNRDIVRTFAEVIHKLFDVSDNSVFFALDVVTASQDWDCSGSHGEKKNKAVLHGWRIGCAGLR